MNSFQCQLDSFNDTLQRLIYSDRGTDEALLLSLLIDLCWMPLDLSNCWCWNCLFLSNISQRETLQSFSQQVHRLLYSSSSPSERCWSVDYSLGYSVDRLLNLSLLDWHAHTTHSLRGHLNSCGMTDDRLTLSVPSVSIDWISLFSLSSCI